MFTKQYLPILIGQFSIIPAVIIGLIRYSKVSRTFYPFIYFCGIGMVTEAVSLAITLHYHANAIVSNIYVLLEFLLIFWQFRNWGFFKKNRRLEKVLLFALPAIWVVEFILFHSLMKYSEWYRMIYSLVIMVMSIDYLNRLFFEETRNFLLNPRVQITLAFVVFFSFKGLYEIFFLCYTPNMRTLFHFTLIGMNVVNALANFTFAFAMLWIPRKDAFSPH